MLVGDNLAGKSALVKCMSSKAVQDFIMLDRHAATFPEWDLAAYEETKYVEIGVQLVDFPDFLTHPMYLRMYDTPGDRITNLKETQSVFENAGVVFVVLDGAHLPYREHLVGLNAFAVENLRLHSPVVQKRTKESRLFRRYMIDLADEIVDELSSELDETPLDIH